MAALRGGAEKQTGGGEKNAWGVSAGKTQNFCSARLRLKLNTEMGLNHTTPHHNPLHYTTRNF